jgi:hypothetical protein
VRSPVKPLNGFLGDAHTNQTTKRRLNMTNENDNRVLVRRGARFLTNEEMGNVNGGLSTGALCSFNPKTGTIDGPKIDCP